MSSTQLRSNASFHGPHGRGLTNIGFGLTARLACAGAALSIALAPALAQSPVIGSVAAERARLAEITGDTSVRAAASERLLSTYLPFVRDVPVLARSNLFVVPIAVSTTWNSDLPYSLNDGPMWAGRGLSFAVNGGLGGRWSIGRASLRLAVAPTLTYSQNLPFPLIPASSASRSPYSAPFHGTDVFPDASLDLPIRFGDRHLLRIDPGRSALSVSVGRVVGGLTAENEWWGPAIRNTLTMSNNAPGVPRLFLSTARPLRTRIGLAEAKLISGTLTESPFFDDDPTNNYRSLSALRLQLRPAFDTNLTLGLVRSVYSPMESLAGPLWHFADVFWRWDVVQPRAVEVGGHIAQSTDQILSLFARWVAPAAGFELYGEWARMDLPFYSTELLLTPMRSGGYTIGFQWAQPKGHARYLRLQSEITYLEQSHYYDNRPVTDFYSGVRSPQGYTNRGQVLGAATGPGSSTQWIAVDYLARRWQGGVFVGRIRWDNDALYRQGAATFLRHDVSILSGLRGAWRAPFSDFASELTVARRYNYLFQNGFANPGGYRTVDVPNLTLTLSATPR